MSAVFLTGATGRLGIVVAKCLVTRGDDLVPSGAKANYLIFAHRYRGEANFANEIQANVEWTCDLIQKARFAEGDCGVVIVSSVNAEQPTHSQSLAYNLSKSALNNAARYFAQSQPVRINTVSPDTFTGPTAKLTAQEVANVIAFLCSPQASGINGQNIVVRK